MLIRLKRALAATTLDSILLVCKELGYSYAFLDEARTLLQLDGLGGADHRTRFEDLTGVASVLEAGSAYELHERAPGRKDTRVTVRNAIFGDGNVSLIGGPCAVEDSERLIEIAQRVEAAGATLLRGGAFKPRTSPYSFQGHGERGLESLAAARAATGLGIVTEVLDPRDVERVGAVCDMFQIGARNMANAPLLREVGRTQTPVLLKRGFAATVREFVLAAETILAEGNEAVVLCERGIRSFDKTTRNLLDVGAVAHLKRATHLPVIVDPSHAAGRADLVRPLSRAGLAAGADGLIIEVHPAPEEAQSDGAQAISAEEFSRITDDARILAGLDGRRLALSGTSKTQPVETLT